MIEKSKPMEQLIKQLAALACDLECDDEIDACVTVERAIASIETLTYYNDSLEDRLAMVRAENDALKEKMAEIEAGIKRVIDAPLFDNNKPESTVNLSAATSSHLRG